MIRIMLILVSVLLVSFSVTHGQEEPHWALIYDQYSLGNSYDATHLVRANLDGSEVLSLTYSDTSVLSNGFCLVQQLGVLLFVSSVDNALYEAPVSGGLPTQILGGRVDPTQLDCGYDAFMLVDNYEDLFVYHKVEGTWTSELILSSTEGIFNPTYSPDGTLIAYESFETTVSYVAVDSHEVVQTSIWGLGAIFWYGMNNVGLTYSDQGNGIVVDIEYQAWVIDVEEFNGAAAVTVNWNRILTSVTAQTEDGYEHRIISVNLNSGNWEFLDGTDMKNPSFSPDGQYFAFVQGYGEDLQIEVFDLELNHVVYTFPVSEDLTTILWVQI